MALADLLQILERDASAEIAAITAAAAADAARIDEESTIACRRRVADALVSLSRGHRAAADAELATAERRAKTTMLAARDAMLTRIRSSLVAVLPALVDDALRARLVVAARTYAPDGTVENVATGVVITSPDGTRVEATLTAILDAAWPRLAAEAIALADRGAT